MRRRSFLQAAGGSFLSGLRSWAAEQRMNVVFMVADDMNNALGCYGNNYVKTPNLDRLAATGVRFDRAYCQFPLCAPSRASFLSGRRPETTQVLSLTVPVRKYMDKVVMLPELFRQNNYYSADCGKIYHTGRENYDPRSWDFVLEESGKKPPESEVVAAHTAGEPRNHTMEWAQLRTPDEKTPDGIVARTAVEQMREAVQKNKNFFVGVGFRRPHAPYAVPKTYFDLYDPRELPLPRVGDQSLLPQAAWFELADQPPLSSKELRLYIAAYYACNSFVDAQAGFVLNALDEMKLAESTAVVFLGDHGYHTGDHGMWHKMTLFEGSCRVPLVIRLPGMKGAGKACRGLVELIDLYPTLAEAAGVSAPAGFEGRSLMPLLNNPLLPGKKAAFTMVGRHDDRNLSAREPSYFGKSVRTDKWRYTEWDEGKRGVELYDETNDAEESRNLVGVARYKSVVDELRGLLRQGAT